MDLIPLNLLVELANQPLRFHKAHLFLPKQFLPDGNKYHLYLKKVIIERLLDALDIYSSEDPKIF